MCSESDAGREQARYDVQELAFENPNLDIRPLLKGGFDLSPRCSEAFADAYHDELCSLISNLESYYDCT